MYFDEEGLKGFLKDDLFPSNFIFDFNINNLINIFINYLELELINLINFSSINLKI